MVQSWRRYTLVITAVTVVLLSLWLYWPTLSLPLIYDTLLHIRITGTLDWISVWLPAKAFGFYRPLTFLPMLVIEHLFGYYPSRLLHGLNVFQHAANAGLLVWLSWRLWRNGRSALTAGLLFALFPFSYQAVAVYGHNVHPTTVCLILVGLHSYLTAFDAKQPFWWAITGFFFVFSLLSHESAVLFGGFAALAQWNHEKKLPPIAPSALHPRRSPWVIFLLLGIIYLIGYQFLPLTRPPDAGHLNLNSIGLRGLYLLQAAVYPLAWLGNRSSINNAPLIVYSGTAVLLAWTAWSLRHWEHRLPLFLGGAWGTAAYTLIAVPLSTSYLLHGPRLLYLGSVGVSLFWATLLESILSSAPPVFPKVSRAALWIGILAFILLTSGIFVRGRLHAYRQLTAPVDTAAAIMADRPQTAGILFINLPQFLDPPRTSYPVGVEFVSMLGHYLFVEELVVDNLNINHPTWAVLVPEQLTAAPYNFAVHEQTSWEDIDFTVPEQHVFLTTYGETGPQTSYTGRLEENTAVSTPFADFGPYQLHAATAAVCEGQIETQLTWSAGSEIPTGTTIFVQIVNPAGQLIGQIDGPPLGLRPELIPVQPNRFIVDLRRLDATGQTPETILIGVYNYLNGERYPATNTQGSSLPDNAWRIPVTPCS